MGYLKLANSQALPHWCLPPGWWLYCINVLAQQLRRQREIIARIVDELRQAEVLR